MSNNINVSLGKSRPFRSVAFIGFGISALIFTTIIYKDLRYREFDFSSKGWEIFFSHIQPAIYLMGGTFALLGLIAALHRSFQTAKQIEDTNNYRDIERYHAHKKSFVEYIEKHFLANESTALCDTVAPNFNSYKLHISLFPPYETYTDKDFRRTIPGKVGELALITGLLGMTLRGRNGAILTEKEKNQLSKVESFIKKNSTKWYFLFCTSSLGALTNEQSLDVIHDSLHIFHKALYFQSDHAFDLLPISKNIEEAKHALKEYNMLDKYASSLVSDVESYLKEVRTAAGLRKPEWLEREASNKYYNLTAEVTVSVSIGINASSLEEAIKKSKSLPVIDKGADNLVWSVDKLDGEITNICEA